MPHQLNHSQGIIIYATPTIYISSNENKASFPSSLITDVYILNKSLFLILQNETKDQQYDVVCILLKGIDEQQGNTFVQILKRKLEDTTVNEAKEEKSVDEGKVNRLEEVGLVDVDFDVSEWHNTCDVKDLDTKYMSPKIANPHCVIEDVVYRGLKFLVVQDGVLDAGSKQRAIIPYLRQFDYREFVYAGPSLGFAQCALAYGCKFLGLVGTVFVEYNTSSPLTDWAKAEGAKVFRIDEDRRRTARLKEVQECAERYVNKMKDKGESIFMLPFGLHDDMYVHIFVANIRRAIPKDMIENNPERMWLVAGSATVLKVLSTILTDTYFLVVQVGKKIWEDQLPVYPDGSLRATKYIAPERFFQHSRYQPPYKSVSTYDAKLWQFVMEHGKSGDYIWNVAADPENAIVENRSNKSRSERHNNYDRYRPDRNRDYGGSYRSERHNNHDRYRSDRNRDYGGSYRQRSHGHRYNNRYDDKWR